MKKYIVTIVAITLIAIIGLMNKENYDNCISEKKNECVQGSQDVKSCISEVKMICELEMGVK